MKKYVLMMSLALVCFLGLSLSANSTEKPTHVETGIQLYEDGKLVAAHDFADGHDCNIGIDDDGTILYADGPDC